MVNNAFYTCHFVTFSMCRCAYSTYTYTHKPTHAYKRDREKYKTLQCIYFHFLILKTRKKKSCSLKKIASMHFSFCVPFFGVQIDISIISRMMQQFCIVHLLEKKKNRRQRNAFGRRQNVNSQLNEQK